jgi:hypothetical protein
MRIFSNTSLTIPYSEKLYTLCFRTLSISIPTKILDLIVITFWFNLLEYAEYTSGNYLFWTSCLSVLYNVIGERFFCNTLSSCVMTLSVYFVRGL